MGGRRIDAACAPVMALALEKKRSGRGKGSLEGGPELEDGSGGRGKVRWGSVAQRRTEPGRRFAERRGEQRRAFTAPGQTTSAVQCSAVQKTAKAGKAQRWMLEGDRETRR